jgi:hypothetical protein
MHPGASLEKSLSSKVLSSALRALHCLLQDIHVSSVVNPEELLRGLQPLISYRLQKSTAGTLSPPSTTFPARHSAATASTARCELAEVVTPRFDLSSTVAAECGANDSIISSECVGVSDGTATVTVSGDGLDLRTSTGFAPATGPTALVIIHPALR